MDCPQGHPLRTIYACAVHNGVGVLALGIPCTDASELMRLSYSLPVRVPTRAPASVMQIILILTRPTPPPLKQIYTGAGLQPIRIPGVF